MARGVNKCIFVGNVGGEPEIRDAGNSRVANLTIAVNGGYKDKSGDWIEQTEWVRLVVWGKLVDVVEKYVNKGDSLYIEGKMQTRKWQNKNGDDQYTTEINVRELTMLGGKSDGGGTSKATNRREPELVEDDGDDLPF